MNKQPTGEMIAIGVINIVYGILTGFFAMLLLIGDDWTPWGEIWPSDPTLMGSEFWGLGLIELILSISLIVAGFGLFQVAPWARALSLMWAVFIIVFNIVEAIMGMMYPSHFIEQIIYPVVIIIIMSLPEWQRAFEGDINEVNLD